MFRVEKKCDDINNNKVDKLFSEEEVKAFVKEEINKNFPYDEKLFNEFLKESLENLKNGRVEIGDLIFIKIKE